LALRCNCTQLKGCKNQDDHVRTKREKAIGHPVINGQIRGNKMYSILILICSTALSHSDCQATTALDVVRGPEVDNAVMCALNAQTMIARTDLVRGDGAEYMKVVCTPTKNADEWMVEVEARKAALQ
jgi:hypothetical protein